MKTKHDFHSTFVTDLALAGVRRNQVNRTDVNKIKRVLAEVKPDQLLELLLYQGEAGWTALDWCLVNKDEESIRTIVQHVITTNDATLLTVVFPYAGFVKSTNLTSHILNTMQSNTLLSKGRELELYVDYSSELLQACTQSKKQTALHVACERGCSDVSSTLLASLQACGEETLKEQLLKPDDYSRTPLHLACNESHTEVALSLLASLQACDNQTMKEALMKPDGYRKTPLDVASEKGLAEIVFEIIQKYMKLSTTEERETLWNLFSHKSKEKSTFSNHERKFYESIMKNILMYLQTGETNETDEVKTLLRFYILLASEKNDSGVSSFHNVELLQIHSEILDMCMEYLDQDIEKDEELSSAFQAFDFLSEGIPYNKASTCHPLVAIGKSDNIALMKHPYVTTYVDICWTTLARHSFYANVIFYMLFLVFFSTFITTHDLNTSKTNMTSDSNRTFDTRHSSLTNASAYLTILFIIFLLILEYFQAKTKGKKYWTLTENFFDLVILIGSLLLIFQSLITEYNWWTHCFGCILIFMGAIRGALILTHMPLVGDKFQMLLSVSWNVVRFLPVLVFFILFFAIMFKNLLQDREPFDHVGLAIVKTIVMAIGEIEFGDLFFNDSNIKLHEVFAFIIFILFLGIMTVSMMNLLIGVVVGDIGELRMQSEQEAFKSKVDLILQYNYMFSKFSRSFHKQTLQKIRKWKTWSMTEAMKDGFCGEVGPGVAMERVIVISCCCCFAPFFLWLAFTKAKFDNKLYTTYKERLEKDYRQYAEKNEVEKLREEIKVILWQFNL